jgi:hypothetical protein
MKDFGSRGEVHQMNSKVRQSNKLNMIVLSR